MRTKINDNENMLFSNNKNNNNNYLWGELKLNKVL